MRHSCCSSNQFCITTYCSYVHVFCLVTSNKLRVVAVYSHYRAAFPHASLMLSCPVLLLTLSCPAIHTVLSCYSHCPVLLLTLNSHYRAAFPHTSLMLSCPAIDTVLSCYLHCMIKNSCKNVYICSCTCQHLQWLRIYNADYAVCVCMHMYMLWVRVPPEAAHFS